MSTRPTAGTRRRDASGQERQAAPARAAAASGLVATGAGLGIGHLAAALVAPASSPIVAVSNRFVDASPTPLKEWAISTFGTADKAVLVAGALVVTLALGALIGLADRRRPARGVAAGGFLALAALAAAWFEPGRPAAWGVPGLVSWVTGAFALVWLLRAARALEPTAAEPAATASRRRFLQLGAAVGGGGLVAAVLGDRLIAAGGVRGATGSSPQVTLPSRSVTPFPAGLESETSGMSAFVTPASELYRIDTALTVPSVEAASWRLNVFGMVDRPFSIGWDELLAMDALERPVTLACVSNVVGGDLIGSARWLGVRTSELLARAGVRPGADQVLSTSIDGFTVSTPIAALTDGREALVAYGMNGAALPREHGYPVRLLTPGLYGFVGATKWLTSMEVTTYAAKAAYWTARGWSTVGDIKRSSRIEVPRPVSTVPAGRVRVGGTAWAHGVGVGRVEVRVDGGPWAEARLGPEAGVQYWRQWLYDWDAAPGRHQLQVRMVDAAGAAQDEANVSPFPDGATGLHSIVVTVA